MLCLHVSSLGVVVLATAPQQQLYITVSYQAQREKKIYFLNALTVEREQDCY